MMSMFRIDILAAGLKGYDAGFSLIEQCMKIQTTGWLKSFESKNERMCIF